LHLPPDSTLSVIYLSLSLISSDKNRIESIVRACVQNLQLAVWERSIGILWNTEPTNYSPTFHAQIGVKPGEKLVGIMQIGYPDMTPKAQERIPIEERLTVITSAAEQK